MSERETSPSEWFDHRLQQWQDSSVAATEENQTP
jgi:hypothetical protein